MLWCAFDTLANHPPAPPPHPHQRRLFLSATLLTTSRSVRVEHTPPPKRCAQYSRIQQGTASSARATYTPQLSTTLSAICIAAEGFRPELRKKKHAKRARLSLGRQLQPSILQLVFELTHPPLQPRPLHTHVGNGRAVESTPAEFCIHRMPRKDVRVQQ